MKRWCSVKPDDRCMSFHFLISCFPVKFRPLKLTKPLKKCQTTKFLVDGEQLIGLSGQQQRKESAGESDLGFRRTSVVFVLAVTHWTCSIRSRVLGVLERPGESWRVLGGPGGSWRSDHPLYLCFVDLTVEGIWLFPLGSPVVLQEFGVPGPEREVWPSPVRLVSLQPNRWWTDKRTIKSTAFLCHCVVFGSRPPSFGRFEEQKFHCITNITFSESKI